MLGPLEPPSIDFVLNDPAGSDWLKSAIRELLLRDPVDAAHDTFWLSAMMDARAKAALKEASNKTPQ